MPDELELALAETQPGAGPVTTICIVGFPPDVTAREVRNVCRFMPGFEEYHLVKSGTLFVKFVNVECSQSAVATLNGLPFDEEQPQHVLRAEFARRDLEPRRSAAPQPMPIQMMQAAQQAPQMQFAQPMQPWMGATAPNFLQSLTAAGGLQLQLPANLQQQVEALQAAAAAAYGSAGLTQLQGMQQLAGGMQFAGGMQLSAGMQHMQGLTPQFTGVGLHQSVAAQPAQMQRISPNDINTITVIGAERKGVAREEVKNWFQQLPGFVTLQVNDRIDAVFVKFISHEAAANAMHEANTVGLGAEWARRNMEEQHSLFQAGVPQPSMVGGCGAACCGGGLLAAKRPRMDLGSGSGEPNTLAVLGVRKRGQDFNVLQEFFESKEGFEKLKVQETIDGIFVKFASQAHAEQVLRDANAMQYGAEWARRNLE